MSAGDICMVVCSSTAILAIICIVLLEVNFGSARDPRDDRPL